MPQNWMGRIPQTNAEIADYNAWLATNPYSQNYSTVSNVQETRYDLAAINAASAAATAAAFPATYGATPALPAWAVNPDGSRKSDNEILAANLATQTANPIISPWSPGTFEVSRGTTVLPTPTTVLPWLERPPVLVDAPAAPAAPIGRPAFGVINTPWVEVRPVLDDSGATQTVMLQTKGGEPEMSLGSLIGNAAKGVLAAVPGGSLLTAGAMALLNSRKETGPPAVAGMLANPLGTASQAIQGIGNVISSSYQTGQNIASNLLAGRPLVGPGGGAGLGAVAPQTKTVQVHRCPRGYARAIDGNCYPKGMLPRSMRMWKPDPKPVVSRSDQKAIKRAASAKHRLVKITKDAGAFASMHKPHPGKAKPFGRKK